MGDDGFGGDAGFDGTAGGNFGGTATANDSSDAGFNGPNGLGEMGTDGSVLGMFGLTQNDVDAFNADQNGMLGMFGLDTNQVNDAVNNGLNNQNETDAEDGPLGKFGKGILGFLSNQALGKGLAALGIPGQALGIANMAGKGTPQGVMSGMANSALGMMGPVGIGLSMAGLGNGIGQAFGGATNAGQGFGGANSSNGGGNAGTGADPLTGLLGGLAGLYMGNRSTGQYNEALGSLNNLYSPNSPYAQQMRQALERKDAASGRRSQYGPREAQLAAMLTQAQSGMLTSPGYGNLMQQRNNSQNQGLQTLLALMQKSGGAKGAWNGLKDLFGGFGGGDQGGFPQQTIGNTDYSGIGLGSMGGVGGFPLGGSGGGFDPGGDGGYDGLFGG